MGASAQDSHSLEHSEEGRPFPYLQESGCCAPGAAFPVPTGMSLHPRHLLSLGAEPWGPRPQMSLAWEAKLVMSLVRRGCAPLSTHLCSRGQK